MIINHIRSGEMANQGGNSAATVIMRDYRKGNWTVQETMVLIEAKKLDDERRMKRTGEITPTPTTSNIEGGGRNTFIHNSSTKPTELRWKWVEDYCWRNGCLRSQNQCNDKWDNLMRDFKKVRDYERKYLLREGDDHKGAGAGAGSSTSTTRNMDDHSSSYWKIDKHCRKERNLPSNMLPEIFQALAEVVERREGLRVVVASGGGSSTSNYNVVVQQQQQQPSSALLPTPLLQYCHMSAAPPPLPVVPPPLPLPLPLPLPPPPSAGQPPHSHQPLPTLDMCGSSDSDTSDSAAAKRRRKGGEGTCGGGGGSNISNEVLITSIGSAISKSASMIAEAIQACEEREEKRHRDLMSLQERRLQIEESKAHDQISPGQGINGLVDAINKLANSILALAANNSRNNQSPPS